MGDAKNIIVKPISAADARRIVKALHYSGKVVNNSQVHLGVFMGGRCGGAMQFGPSTVKRNLIGLVTGTLWNEFVELNRMAFADWLPRNGESRAIGYAMRWLRKTYPWLKWVVSFADACQCGDGTIYRASGFVLTGITRNASVFLLPDGSMVNSNDWQSHANKRAAICKRLGTQGEDRGASGTGSLKRSGGKAIPGFQLRYLYFLDPTARDRLTVPILPFSDIDKLGAGMYKGKPRTIHPCAGSDTCDTPAVQAGEGGPIPTPALHISEGEAE